MLNAVLSLPESPTLLGAQKVPPQSGDSLINLIHDLRQPLSAMEAIAYYLELTVPAEQAQTRYYVSRLQQLVQEAGATLSAAVRESQTHHVLP